MNLNISERFTIASPLSIEEVQARLSSAVEPKQRQRFPSYSTWKRKPYQGTLNSNDFQIERVISYRNSFLPIITGKMEARKEGTEIEIYMDMHVGVYLFLGVWLAFLVFIILATFCSGLSSGSFTWLSIMPFVMVIFGIAMTIGGFQFEARKSRAFLYDLFEVDGNMPE